MEETHKHGNHRERLEKAVARSLRVLPMRRESVGLLKTIRVSGDSIETRRSLIEAALTDPGLAAWIFKYYGLSGLKGSVVSIAVMLRPLNAANFARYVLKSASCMEQASCPWLNEEFDKIVSHSRRVAVASRILGEALGMDPESMDEVWIAGLLHDVGQLVLLALEVILETHREKEFLAHWAQKLIKESFWVDGEFSGELVDHVTLGASIGKVWGFPPFINDVIAHHHNPLSSANFPLQSTIVFMANFLILDLQAVNWDTFFNRSLMELTHLDSDQVKKIKDKVFEEIQKI